MESNTKYTPDSIVQGVIDDLISRAEVGLKKYNTTMDREDLSASDWVQHAYEEVLDLALYLKRLKKDIISLEAKSNNFNQTTEEVKTKYNYRYAWHR